MEVPSGGVSVTVAGEVVLPFWMEELLLKFKKELKVLLKPFNHSVPPFIVSGMLFGMALALPAIVMAPAVPMLTRNAL